MHVFVIITFVGVICELVYELYSHMNSVFVQAASYSAHASTAVYSCQQMYVAIGESMGLSAT